MPLVSKTFSEIITFTRASNATYFDATGTLQTATSGTPRFDYDPSTLAPRGFLIEEQRTNSIRNNTMQGAVAGTPGTLPTNWQSNGGAVAINVIGTGTENGITYIDVRFVGTPNQTFANLRFETNNQIVAANGQTWTSTFYIRRVAGSNTNVSDVDNRIYYRDGAGGAIQETGVSVLSLLSNASLNISRGTNTLTGANASIAYLSSSVNLTTTVGLAIDITLRIGLPQLELGAFATSVIPTSTVAVTRNADVASVNTLSPWYNASAGTLYAEYVRFGALNFQNIASLGNAAQTEQATLVFGSGAPSNNQRFDVTSGGVSQASITVLTSPALNTIAKTAGAYAANDFAATANGAVPGTDPSGTVPTPTTLSLGTGAALTGPFLNGWLRRVTYYPRRLSNAELQTLTT